MYAPMSAHVAHWDETPELQKSAIEVYSRLVEPLDAVSPRWYFEEEGISAAKCDTLAWKRTSSLHGRESCIPCR